MSAIERAIANLSDPHVSLADALRGLLVVSRRIGSTQLTQWLRAELDGYARGDDVPTYRVNPTLPVRIRFDGYGGSWEKRSLMPHELPEKLRGVAQDVEMRQPAAELVALATGERDLHVQLPGAWIATYRELADQERAITLSMHVVNDAELVIPKTLLVGMLDRIKSTALDLALDIEDVSAVAGDQGGPTVATNPQLADAVHHSVTTIYATNSTITLAGETANVASGDGAVVDGSVKINDVNRVLATAREYLTDEGVAELADAIEQDGGAVGQNTRTFMERVKSGGAGVAQGVVGNVAFTGIMTALGLG